MNESKISVRYAKALHQLAREEKKDDNIKNDMEAVLTCTAEVPEFKEFLHSPVLKESEKSHILKTIFKGKVSDLTLSLFDLLVKNKRESYLPFIARNYLHFYKEELGIKEAILTTAIPVDETFKQNILKYLTKKLKMKIDMVEQVDNKIIGGFKLKIEDQQIDASISSRLHQIQRVLINSK